MEKKLKHSNFLITINTNSRNDDLKEVLRAAVGRFYLDIDQYITYAEGDTFKDVSRVTGEGVIEVGSQSKYIHAHALVCINHYSNIKLDLSAMRDFFGESIGRSGTEIHLNVKCVRGQQNVREYLRKTVRGK